jgi:hypothetical protein
MKVDMTARTPESQRRPGNRNAMTHGLYSAKRGRHPANRRITWLANKVWYALPWLAPTDEPAVRRWCELEILRADVLDNLLSEGVTGSGGDGRKLLTDYRQLVQTQLAYERELGMTPASRINLGVEMERGQNLDLQRQIAEAKIRQGSDDAYG